MSMRIIRYISNLYKAPCGIAFPANAMKTIDFYILLGNVKLRKISIDLRSTLLLYRGMTSRMNSTYLSGIWVIQRTVVVAGSIDDDDDNDDNYRQ